MAHWEHFKENLVDYETAIIACGGNDICHHPKKPQQRPKSVEFTFEAIKSLANSLVNKRKDFVMSITQRPSAKAKIQQLNEMLEKNFNYIGVVTVVKNSQKNIKKDNIHYKNMVYRRIFESEECKSWLVS